MASEVRKAAENGIWLCQNCAKLIDNDEQKYTVHLLEQWKTLSEQAALLDIENRVPTSITQLTTDDIELIRFYSLCLDRPAFQDLFHEEGSIEAFDRAIEDTITALNTGCLRARDGQILAQGKGKSFLENHAWRERMDAIVDMLRAIRSRYLIAVQTGQIRLDKEHQNRQWYHVRDREVSDWMDNTRVEIMRVFSEVCDTAGVPPLYFPRRFRRK